MKRLSKINHADSFHVHEINNDFIQVESDVSCVKWTGDVLHRNQTKPICGLEISFLSVPQDIDIKLIPDIHG